MKIIRARAAGGPEQLGLDELPTPEPGPGQARVRVAYAGVNFIDVYHRSGLYPSPPPIAIGREGAGAVEAVGPGVDLAIGARVAWASVAGSYATHVIAPASQLIPIPDGVSDETAAALTLQGMTAHYLTESTFSLTSSTICLLHAAAGGVGLLIAQRGKRIGATVIGTTSTDAKAERARAAGCTHVIRYDREDFVARTRELTGGRGVDVVYDSVGKSTFLASLDCLRPRGMAVLFGQSSGPVPPFDLQLLNQKGSLFVTRPTLGHYTATRDELVRRATVALRELTPTIDRVLPLADAAAAHRLLESRATSGKLLLDAR